MNEELQKTECCPKFEPAPWDNKIFEWTDKKFVKDKVFTLFYIPINFGKVITRMITKKVYEGDFKETGKWCKDFADFAKAQGMQVKKMFMWYTTCPKCAKKYGKNYVVIVANVG